MSLCSKFTFLSLIGSLSSTIDKYSLKNYFSNFSSSDIKSSAIAEGLLIKYLLVSSRVLLALDPLFPNSG